MNQPKVLWYALYKCGRSNTLKKKTSGMLFMSCVDRFFFICTSHLVVCDTLACKEVQTAGQLHIHS